MVFLPVKVQIEGVNTIKAWPISARAQLIHGVTRRNIEVNIFDFDQDIYNQQIRMEFHNFVRGDMKFDSSWMN